MRGRGVALFYRDSDLYEVEEQRIWGPNVLSFKLKTEDVRYYVVGAYIAPSSLDALADIDKAWAKCPKACKSMLLGDLNINLDKPRNDRDVAVTEQVTTMDLMDMMHQFYQ